mmetsp:Transcript_27615/g.31053  ORF Transcript_27615/g.31053 Transcript_27615/m.31053 type:complete len:109 (+) Transcript_27615:1033-1359(+)
MDGRNADTYRPRVTWLFSSLVDGLFSVDDETSQQHRPSSIRLRFDFDLLLISLRDNQTLTHSPHNFDSNKSKKFCLCGCDVGKKKVKRRFQEQERTLRWNNKIRTTTQ